MKSTPTLRRPVQNKSRSLLLPVLTRPAFLLTVVSLAAVAALLGVAVSANKANRVAKAHQLQEAQAAASRFTPIKNSIASQQRSTQQNPNAPLAPVIGATLVDAFPVHLSGKADPGDTITYTATITNTGSDATGMTFTDVLSPNTTQTGTVNVSPVTLDDTYPQTVIGNVSINSALIPFSVLTNDYLGQNPGGTITAFDAASAQGGNVVVNADGTFTYNPPPGYEGADTFHYTLSNATGSSIGIVNLTVTGMVWFINNNAAACTTLAAGCGRLSNPFSTLAAFNALNNGTGNNPAVNDNIFVFESATAYTGPVTLLGGQKFIGQDATASLATITGLTPPSGSTAFPAMNSGNGTITKITSGGNAINLNSVGTSNLIRGLTVGNTTGIGINGTTFGTLTVADADISDGAGRTGQALSLTTGTLAATFASVLSTNSSATGITLSGVGGSLTSTTTSITNPNGIGISVGTSSASLNFGSTSSTQSSNTGVSLLTNTGTITFGSLTITPDASQRGLLATDNTQTLTATSGAITTSGAIAVEITRASSTTPLAISLTNVTATGSPVNGIKLTNTSGAFTVAGTGGTCTIATPTCTGGSIQTATNAGILLNNAAGVSLTRMKIQDPATDGINATTVNGLIFDNGIVTDAAGASGDQGMELTNMSGTVTVSNSTISGSPHNNIFFVNTNTNLAAFNLTNSTIQNNSVATGNDGVLFVAAGTSVVTAATVSGCSFLNIAATALQPQTQDTATITNFTITGTTFTTNNVAIDADVSQGSHLTTTIGGPNVVDGNTFTFTTGPVVINVNSLTTTTAGSTLTAKIQRNNIGVQGTIDSGARQGNGIRASIKGLSHGVVFVDQNNIREIPNAGGIVLAGTNGTGGANFKVTNNTLPRPTETNFDTGCGGGATPCPNNTIDIQSQNGNTVCSIVTGNTAYDPESWPQAAGLSAYLMFQSGSTLRLEGTNPNATTQLASTNTVTNSTPGGNDIETFGSVTVVAAGTCGAFPALPNPVDDTARNGGSVIDASKNAIARTESSIPASTAKATQSAAAVKRSAPPVRNSPISVNAVSANKTNRGDVRLSHHAARHNNNNAASDQKLAPLSGETIGPITIGTLPANKSVTIVFQALVNTPPLAKTVSTQGTVHSTTASFADVLTDDPATGPVGDPTITPIDTTATWSGTTSTDWNVATNWTQGFVPNSVSDVVIPSVGVTNEPTLTPAAVNVFSLDLQSGRTLTINSGSTLTVNTGLTSLAGALAGGPYTLNFVALTINRAAGITVNGPTSVSGVLTLTSGNVTTGANVLTIGSAGSIVRTSGHIVGSLKKTGVAGAFIFTVGTAAGYTPVDLSSPSGGGDLTVTTVAAPQPTLQANNPGKQLNEYWTLTSVGTLTANLVFHYLQSDVPVTSNENNYRIHRVSGGTPKSFLQACPTTSCVDPAGNTATKSATAFNNAGNNGADWTVGEVLAPTAADGVVTGRIVDSNGMPVEGAVIRLSGTQNRKFITDANGVYRFEQVETSGFYTVTPSRVNYTFNPSSRSFSQVGETTEAAFGATATGQAANPLDTPEYFVRQHYLDFLGREPDEAGFNFWSDQILECGNDNLCVDRRRENVSAAYFFSIEFQQTGGLVDGLYKASYGVHPEFAQFMPDTRAVGLGVVVGVEGWQDKLKENKQAFAEAFVNRAAFHAAYDGMDNSLFVDTLIANTGVSFTAGERDALGSGLAGGTMTRADVVRSIAENNHFVNAKFNEVFVMMEYFGYLRRDADSSGFQFWLSKLNQFGGNFEQAEMVKAFIVSGEFRDRFPR